MSRSVQMEFEYVFVENDRQEERECKYLIVIKPTGNLEIDMTVLESYCKGGTSIDMPLRAIQALDIVLKSSAAKRYAMAILRSAIYLEIN